MLVVRANEPPPPEDGPPLSGNSIREVAKPLSPEDLIAPNSSPEEGESELLRQVFDAEIESYLGRLLDKIRAAYDGPVELPEISIRLCDQNSFAAAVPAFSSIMIDKRLLLHCKTEDEVAFVIGHELAHFIYRWEKYGDERTRFYSEATVDEETRADYIGQDLAVKAGYSRLGGAEFIESLIKKDESFGPAYVFNRLREVIDKHLDNYTRLVNLKKDFLGGTRLTTGNSQLGLTDVPSTPLPGWIKGKATQLEHVSYLDQLKQAFDYESLDAEQQIKFIIKILPTLTNRARLSECASLIFNFRTEGIPSVNPALGHELFDATFDAAEKLVEIDYIGTSRVAKDIYQMCAVISRQDLWDQQEEKREAGHSTEYDVLPVGRLRQSENAVIAYNNSTTTEEAVEAAAHYKESQELFEKARHTFFENTLNYTLVLPPVNLPDKPDGSNPRFAQVSQDDTGTLREFFCELPYRYHSEEVYDEIPLTALSRQAELDPEFGRKISRYVERRQALECLTIPPDLEAVHKDPEGWAKQYEPVLRFILGYRDDKVSKFHPYYGKDKREQLEIHGSCWRALCSELQQLVERGHRGQARKIVLSASKFGEPHYFDGELHPVLDFIYKHPNLFSLKDKIRLATELFSTYSSIEEKAKIVNISLPDSFKDLGEFIDSVKGNRLFPFFSSYPSSYDDKQVNNIPNQMFIRILRAKLEDGEFSAEERAEIAESFATLPPVAERGHFADEQTGLLQKVFVEQYDKSRDLADAEVSSLSGRAALELYHQLNDNRLFTDRFVRRAWGDRLVESIRNEKNLEQRYRLYHDALENSNFYASRIQDLPIRAKLVEGFADTIFELIGRYDDGSEGYKDTVFRLAFGGRHTSTAVRRDLCGVLAKKVRAQRELAYQLRDKCSLTAEEKKDASLPTKACEQLLREASEDKELRHLFLEWITSDGGTDATEKFRLAVIEHGKKERYFSRHFDQMVFDRSDKDGDLQSQKRYFDLSEEDQARMHRMVLNDLYAHFSDQERDIQALLLKHILIPAKEDYERGEEVLWENCDVLLDRLFPLDEFDETEQERENAKFSRELVRTLLEVSHESERGFILGAIAAAARSSNSETEKRSVGKLVRGLLTNLGPAYIKLGQALHSSDATPEDIREHLADLKGKVDEYLVWETWELIDDLIEDGSMPESAAQNIKLLGECVGAASINLVNYFTDSYGELSALGLTRRHARNLASKGFQSMADMVDRAECLQPYRKQALEIIEHARELALLETDTEIGAIQAELQYEQYDGCTVSVGWKPFVFKPRAWLAYGPGWRTMEAATGKVFDELPEETEAQRKHKDQAAMAILVMELRNILRGKQFDYNRHERQYLVDGRTIYPVDAGGMSLEPPSEEDKRQLGTVLGQFLGEALSNGNSTEDAFEDLWERCSGSDYMHRVRESILYLSFAFRRQNPEDLKGIVLAVLASGEVDRTIESAMATELEKADLKLPRWTEEPLFHSAVALFKGWPVFWH